jgi:hypothetical protein
VRSIGEKGECSSKSKNLLFAGDKCSSKSKNLLFAGDISKKTTGKASGFFEVIATKNP